MKSPVARPAVAVSLVLLSMWVLIAIFADLIASDVPLIAAARGDISVLPEHAADWDWSISAPLGRDDHVLSRTIHGARSSALVTAVVLAVALFVGFAAGALAGFGPPIADSLLSRAVELSGALPTLVLLALLHDDRALPGLSIFVLVLAVMRSIHIARLVRGEVLRVTGQDFVVAARALGTPRWRIAWTQVMPHVMGPVLVAATFTAGSVVATEAALSFLGLGLPPAVESWGTLLGASGDEVAPGGKLLPAAAIVATTAACWLVADALDDAWSARRGRSRTW